MGSAAGAGQRGERTRLDAGAGVVAVGGDSPVNLLGVAQGFSSVPGFPSLPPGMASPRRKTQHGERACCRRVTSPRLSHVGCPPCADGTHTRTVTMQTTKLLMALRNRPCIHPWMPPVNIPKGVPDKNPRPLGGQVCPVW